MSWLNVIRLDFHKISAYGDIRRCNYNISAIGIDNEKSIEFLDNDEYMEIKVLLSDDITNSLILNMMTMLKELEKRYPKNIKVNEE